MSNFSDSEIIKSIINSHFYFWGGEGHPSGHTFNTTIGHLDGTSTTKTKTNNKFHGFYDVDKISESDYKLIDADNLNKLIEKAVNFFSDGDPDYLQEVQKCVNEYLADQRVIFHLALDREFNKDKLNEYSVYSSFEGFLLINRSQNKVAILEVGED